MDITFIILKSNSQIRKNGQTAELTDYLLIRGKNGHGVLPQFSLATFQNKFFSNNASVKDI